MSDLFYRTVHFLPKHKNNETLAVRCLKILHGFSKKYQLDDIATSFPAWNTHTVGDRLTLVSEAPLHLDALLSQKYFQEMQNRGYFSISALKSVPENAEYAYFYRNQSIDEAFPKAEERKARRLARRAESRGEIYRPEHNPQQMSFGTYHSLRISSKESGNDFRLNIQREPAIDCHRRTATSYGLSNKTTKRFAVPLI